MVFVHAEPDSYLRNRTQNIDLVGATQILQGSRFDVAEWNVTAGKRPRPEVGQPVVVFAAGRSLAVANEEKAAHGIGSSPKLMSALLKNLARSRRMPASQRS